ncbi:MAG: aminotransferase class IV [Bdellovibrionales bacterium]|nr:aminotransferase class IV [Bdellovibrionales bacterium]
MLDIDILDESEWLNRLKKNRQTASLTTKNIYYAMYSSWWNGVVLNPSLMLVPVDEHMVHRGDGVFETVRVSQGAIFDLDGHLNRLKLSAESIQLALPKELHEIKKICLETVKATQLQEVTLRIYVGRGPGSFTPNPYESVGSQLYVIVTEFKPLPESAYLQGVSAMVSQVPQKSPFYAQIKSCNYLPNVLMKKEAIDHQVDFSLGCDSEGRILEGSTENLLILSQDNQFCIPNLSRILKGTTLEVLRISMERNPSAEMPGSIYEKDFFIHDLLKAKEVYMVGTTLEALPVIKIDGKLIGKGRPGPFAKDLRSRIQWAVNSKDSPHRTEVYS